MGSRLTGRIWVTCTSLLIAFISYSSQIFIIWPWYGHELSLDLIYLLGPFNILVSLLYYNYFLCVTVDPGRVPRNWIPDFNSGDDVEVKKLTGGPRYCRTCEKYKPPRAHHCKQCRRCILRMDHHCPWVNNCIGHFNYAHFLRFLFFVDVACTYHLAMVTARVRDSFGNGYWIEPSNTEIVFIVLNYTTCVPVILAVGIFSLYHFYCVLTNTTTIEGWEKDKVATLIRRGKIREVKFPYDLGVAENLKSVLGRNPLLWCWPTNPTGNGLKYQVGSGEGKWVEFRRREHPSELED
ncbi:zf-DHHC-domain-containing protein [Sistotremastrum niveocremeum HHB9708]|uniref:Palmitoyltransferase n=1 Tax=Sistotremastrum niveocremeum HHB9708 TaxID=1314777 RepID=A0A164URG3_9AGAM|nr:zf-DHHC-domain-containing protein [Sistotremastrum niveocremeum HHB9708]